LEAIEPVNHTQTYVPVGSNGAGHLAADIAEPQSRLTTTPGAGRESWGRYPVPHDQQVTTPGWLEEAATIVKKHAGTSEPLLAYGQGRSYGDSCLNSNGRLIETTNLSRLIAFDPEAGILTCEAGTTLAEILDFGVPRGWFLPTTPGTKFVSVGGAIANDVHGKNHHVAGTFGRHVLQFELIRSSGERMICSPDKNPEMYAATIGGLGLTGFITWATIRLKPVSGPYINMESIRFRSLDEFFEVSTESDRDFECTMSWVDCMATGKSLGRGLFMRGNHAWQPQIPGKSGKPVQRIGIPFDLPIDVLTGMRLRAFNTLLYHRQLPRVVRATVPFDPFFYPLDSIKQWNRMYGRNGFLQHQCVVPHESARVAMREILTRIATAGEGSFLAVLKAFGDLKSPGMLSFPRPGITLALDFKYKGPSTLRLLDSLDEVVMDHGGAIYPAKDARMSPATFEASFPNWREFVPYIDEHFSSDFWRRVTGSKDGRPE
jgi:FAD/FMN-containing dehydrogenase